MTRPLLLLPLLLGLAACGNAPSRPAGPALLDAQCRAEAEASIPARAASRSFNPNTVGIAPTQGELSREEAVAAAYRDCLRRRGMAAPGGVERVRRGW